jgi:hypothetical protein
MLSTRKRVVTTLETEHTTLLFPKKTTTPSVVQFSPHCPHKGADVFQPTIQLGPLQAS